MSKERLSRLQKFILTACYQKTKLKEPLPKRMSYFYYDENLYVLALYESDILLNYYDMDNWNHDENYGYSGGSNKEKTALRRSLKILYDRGYINDYNQWQITNRDDERYFYCSRAIITLTLKGEETAKRILNVVEGTNSHNYNNKEKSVS